MNKAYVIKKLFQALVTVFLVLVLNYILFRVMPGDPLAMLMRNPKASPEAVAKTRALFGLDKPWYVQFGLYIKQLFRGDLGFSFLHRKPVSEVIASRLLPTILLAGLAEIIAITVGTLIGIVSAWKRGKKIDTISLSFSLITYSMPTFWLGILLVSFFSVSLRIFPTTGMMTPGAAFRDLFALVADVGMHLVLPVLTLALVLIGEYALVMRNSLLDVLTEDYVTTAKAKGFTEKYVIRKHAVPNALLPMVTIIAINLGLVIGGTIQVETIFSWPGLGRLMYDALINRDYPLLQGIFLLVSLAVIGANFCADILYGYLDPRVRG
ncbi:MAG: ABC transporter permease [Spirochaetales bacterium]|nr:ABC transporter permease [Spirochaetales bacterium]